MYETLQGVHLVTQGQRRAWRRLWWLLQISCRSVRPHTGDRLGVETSIILGFLKQDHTGLNITVLLEFREKKTGHRIHMTLGKGVSLSTSTYCLVSADSTLQAVLGS